MDKQDFQEQDFMEILMRLPCDGEHTRIWSRTYARIVASKRVYGRHQTHISRCKIKESQQAN